MFIGLLSACLAISAAFYFLLQPPKTVNAKKPKTETYPLTNAEKKAPPYQAKIEQQVNGIVITLQGPDYEEVLTKLPPGYYPTIEDNKIIHVVTPGNTLWFIAKRYIKNPYRYPELVQLNKIKNPDLIYPGDRVIIQHIGKRKR